jgi:hypothetical protein
LAVDKKQGKSKFSLLDIKKSVKGIIPICVSKIEMSPITAKLKCPHGRGKDTDESEAVTEVSGDGIG